METVLTSSVITTASFLLTILAFVFYLYLKYVVYNFWGRKGVPHKKPSIPLGNVPISYFKGETLHGTIMKESYMKFKKYRFSGLYILWEPILLINDPELIRLVLVKNFNQFYNRGRLFDERKDPLSAILVRMEDDKWKRLKGKLSPAFTSGKLKLMYSLIEEICHELIGAIDKTLVHGNEIEFKEFITRFTVDCISLIAYGFNADSLNNTDSLFLKYGKSSTYIGRVFILFSFFIPQLMKFIPVSKKRKENGKFFIDLFMKMVEHRRKENISRNDILNMIMQLVNYGTIVEENINTSNKLTEADKLTMMEGVAQSFMFFSAGQETTSSTITCCLYELAINPHIQGNLYGEVCKVKSSPGGLTFEKLFEMKYLDMVFQETLRKYPALPFLSRICNEDFKILDSNFTIKKGMRIAIPLLGLHMDPEIFPEPDKFDPSRFTPENCAKRHNFTYLPFDDGPRQCIGKRLSSLKSKIALFYLVWHYKFSPCKSTPDSIRFLPDHIIQVPCDLPLKIEKRNQSKESTN